MKSKCRSEHGLSGGPLGQDVTLMTTPSSGYRKAKPRMRSSGGADSFLLSGPSSFSRSSLEYFSKKSRVAPLNRLCSAFFRTSFAASSGTLAIDISTISRFVPKSRNSPPHRSDVSQTSHEPLPAHAGSLPGTPSPTKLRCRPRACSWTSGHDMPSRNPRTLTCRLFHPCVDNRSDSVISTPGAASLLAAVWHVPSFAENWTMPTDRSTAPISFAVCIENPLRRHPHSHKRRGFGVKPRRKPIADACVVRPARSAPSTQYGIRPVYARLADLRRGVGIINPHVIASPDHYVSRPRRFIRCEKPKTWICGNIGHRPIRGKVDIDGPNRQTNQPRTLLYLHVPFANLFLCCFKNSSALCLCSVPVVHQVSPGDSSNSGAGPRAPRLRRDRLLPPILF